MLTFFTAANIILAYITLKYSYSNHFGENIWVMMILLKVLFMILGVYMSKFIDCKFLSSPFIALYGFF